MYLVVQGNNEVSVTDLHHHLGISFKAAERMGHKLMQVMVKGDAVVFPFPSESSTMMHAEVGSEAKQARPRRSDNDAIRNRVV